ncbi:MAG: hypothetical protein JWO36_6122 [Myxococcales bacterium]|nr:hypothetical protein [Myxococcales bacterium]
MGNCHNGDVNKGFVGWMFLLTVGAAGVAAAGPTEEGAATGSGSGSSSPAGGGAAAGTETAAGSAPGSGTGSTATGTGSGSVTANAEHAITPLRKPDATYGQMFRGPFQSTRLFAMPTADTVGAFMLSLSGDGSLLQQPGVLTSAGVIAIGFGDIAQLEYRHTEAISVTGVNAPLPGVGVQVRLPIPESSGVPVVGVALRFGVPRTETVDSTTIKEKVSDVFFVIRERFDSAPWLTLHEGLRISPTTLDVSTGGMTRSFNKTLYLPTTGIELATSKTAKLVGELAYAPRFNLTPGQADIAQIEKGVLGRLGVRWSLIGAVVLDASFGYQLNAGGVGFASSPRNVVEAWDIRLGAEVFVPWGALACKGIGVFCD